MPEGDTVWRVCRRLRAVLAGKLLTRAELRVPQLADVDLSGVTVLEVISRGKHQLFRFDSGWTLHTHLRMDGAWRTYPAGQIAPIRRSDPIRRPDSIDRTDRPGRIYRPDRTYRTAQDRSDGQEHEIRVLLSTAEIDVVGYRLPVVELLPTAEEDRVVGHLGPDLLGPDWDLEEALRRIRRDPDRSIGEALLDQRNLAGIGTFYRAEVLFLQGVHPRTPVSELANLPRVVQRSRQLLQANKERPEQVTTGDLRAGRRAYVFERVGQPCRRCRTPIRTEEFGPVGQERRSYWCPVCQPLGEKLSSRGERGP